MVKAPIWKDTYYTTTASSLNYRIVDGNDNTILFSGRAVAMPNQDRIRININKVCQDYLEQDILTLLSISGSSSQQNTNAQRDFYITTSQGVTLESYRFIYCWDYDFNWSGEAATLSEPVNGHFVSGMMKPKTMVSSNTNEVNTYRSTGNYTKEVCAEYGLLYVNRKGGWDMMVFEGKCSKTDNINQYTYSKTFDNTTIEFEDVRYITYIDTQYELNTGILSEEESERFAKHLIGSNKCYLQNFKEGWTRPVIITDTQAQYKTYDTEEAVISYKVTVKESQSKQRM